ncbi:MAG: DUF5615 family PIN-like protein [Spirochaetia bacterium]|nr:DUF5615 family PIN-like protein [Spirochaetia bacterium]
MLILDENISHKIVIPLSNIFPGLTHIKHHNLVSSPDNVVWEFARQHNLCIVSFDNDFEAIFLRNGFPPKILRITKGNITPAELISLLVESEKEIKEFISNDSTGYMEII